MRGIRWGSDNKHSYGHSETTETASALSSESSGRPHTKQRPPWAAQTSCAASELRSVSFIGACTTRQQPPEEWTRNGPVCVSSIELAFLSR
jgi:hypothetical protein